MSQPGNPSETASAGDQPTRIVEPHKPRAVAKRAADSSDSVPAVGSDSSTRSTEGTDKLIGQKLGKYTILHLLGKGGMGAVYEARDELIDRAVAIKVLPETVSADEGILKRFLMEARAAGRLNHPNAVAVFDVDQLGSVYFIVMELVRGSSAQEFIKKRGPFNWPEATRVIRDACRALGAAHAAGLIHRDIKPANIMRAADGTVKIADFGLAKSLVDGDTGVTKSGSIMGTPLYMSPEQCQNERLDARSDIYSLGATFFALLTGKAPFSESTTIPQIMFSHCFAERPDPRTLNDVIPESVALIVRKAMARNPAERYQTAEEMCADLDSVFVEQGTQQSLSSENITRSQLMSAVENQTATRATVGGGIAALRSQETLAALPGGPALVPNGSLTGWSGEPTMRPASSSQTLPVHSGLGRPAGWTAGSVAKGGELPQWLLPASIGGVLLLVVVVLLVLVSVRTSPPADGVSHTTGVKVTNRPRDAEPSAEDGSSAQDHDTAVGPDGSVRDDSTVRDQPTIRDSSTAQQEDKRVGGEYNALLTRLKAAKTSKNVQELLAALSAVQTFINTYENSRDAKLREFARYAERLKMEYADEVPKLSLSLRPSGTAIVQPGRARLVAPLDLGRRVALITDGPEPRLLLTGVAEPWEQPHREDQVRRFSHQQKIVHALASRPDGSVLLLGNVGLEVFSPKDGSASLPQELLALDKELPPGPVTLSSDGQTLAASDDAGKVRLWNTQTARPHVHTQRTLGHKLTQLAVSADGGWLVGVPEAGGSQRVGTLLLSGAAGKEPAVTLTAHEGPIAAFTLSPDGRWLATAADKQLRVWESLTGRLAAELVTDFPVSALGFCADGRRLAVATNNRMVRLYEILETVWADDFESYPNGRWPPPPPGGAWENWLALIHSNRMPSPIPGGYWFPDGAALAFHIIHNPRIQWGPKNRVDSRQAKSGKNSLCLFGADDHTFIAWGHRAVEADPPFLIEAHACVSNEPQNAGHNRQAAISLRMGYFWRSPYAETQLISNLHFGDNVWGKVLISYDRIGELVLVTTWLNDRFSRRYARPREKFESDAQNRDLLLQLSSHVASVWFDDVRVLRPCGQPTTPTPDASQLATEVAAALIQANPGFTGEVEWHYREGRIVGASFIADTVRDLRPLQRLTDLLMLRAVGSGPGQSPLTDITPLSGLPLVWLDVRNTQVSSFAPLRGLRSLEFINGLKAGEVLKNR